MVHGAVPNASSIPANGTEEDGWETNGSTGVFFNLGKIFIAIVITLLIICNNLINMIVLKKMRDINRRMKILLFSLSISDFCLGVVVCIPAVVSGLLGYWPFSDVACQLTGTMNGVAIAVSLWSLMAISIERSVLMRKVVARKDKVILPIIFGVIFIWVFNVAFFAFPIFLEEDYIYYRYDHDVMSCSFRWKSSVYFIIAKMLYPILSGVVIVISSIRIHIILRQAQLIRQNMTSEMERAGHVGHNSPRPSESSPSSRVKRSKRGKESKEARKATHESAVSQNNNETIPHNGHSNVYMGPPLETTDFLPLPSNSVMSSQSRNHSDSQQNGSNQNWKGHASSVESVSRNEHDKTQNVMPRSVFRRNTKARLLLICTSALFFLTTTPYMVSSLIDHFLVGWQMPHALKFVALWMLNTNSFINVYVYSAIYGEFRHHCRDLLRIFECTRQSTGPSRAPRSVSESFKKASRAAMPKRYVQGESSMSRCLEDACNRRGGDDGNSFDVGTSYHYDQSVSDFNPPVPPTSPRGRLVLIPRNDAGVPGSLPACYQSLQPRLVEPANQTSTLMAINSVQLNMLPSVEI